jgi:hypothetical protein
MTALRAGLATGAMALAMVASLRLLPALTASLPVAGFDPPSAAASLLALTVGGLCGALTYAACGWILGLHRLLGLRGMRGVRGQSEGR